MKILGHNIFNHAVFLGWFGVGVAFLFAQDQITTNHLAFMICIGVATLYSNTAKEYEEGESP